MTLSRHATHTADVWRGTANARNMFRKFRYEIFLNQHVKGRWMLQSIKVVVVGLALTMLVSHTANATITSPGCRDTFGYDKNGIKHCNLAEWQKMHDAKVAKKKAGKGPQR